jgi:hypothetical protein
VTERWEWKIEQTEQEANGGRRVKQENWARII